MPKLHTQARLNALATGIALASFTLSAQAQLEEVVVTAQKRTESVQAVPIAVSSVDNKLLGDLGVVSIQDIVDYVPGLSGVTQGGLAFNVWAIRGIATSTFGDGADPSVGVFLNDAYIGRNVLANTAAFDLNRIEVVKGPQGTLFGRNAVAGAISMYSNRATIGENTLDLKLGAGNLDQKIGELTGNLGLGDSAALRLAIMHNEREGHLDNVITGKDVNGGERTAFRLSGAWDPADTVFIHATYEEFEWESNNYNGVVEDVLGDLGNDKAVSPPFDNYEEVDTRGFNLRVEWDISDSITLTSITDYRYFEIETDVDVVRGLDSTTTAIGTSLDPTLGIPINAVTFYQLTDSTTWSQEFRLNGSHGNIDWFVGASYFEEDIESDNQDLIAHLDTLDLGLLDPALLGFSGRSLDNTSDKGDYKAYAVYGDLTWRATDRLSLTLGIRWTRDEKDWYTQGESDLYLLDGVSLDPENPNVPLGHASTIANGLQLPGCTGFQLLAPCTQPGGVSDNKAWTNTSPRVVLDYMVADEVMLYGSVSQGYKAGGFNVATNVVDVDPIFGLPIESEVIGFDPEEITAYELGVKSTLADGNVRLNVAAYYNDYEDLQVETIIGGLPFTQNAAEAEVKGAEVELTWLATEGLRFDLGYAYTDATYKDGELSGVDASGLRLVATPENTLSIRGTYSHSLGAGRMDYLLGYNWLDKYHFDQLNDPNMLQDSYYTLDARIQYTGANDRWDIALVGENVTSEEYVDLMENLLGFGISRQYAPEALYRVEARLYFDF